MDIRECYDTAQNDLSCLLLSYSADIFMFSRSFCFDAKVLINNAWLFYGTPFPSCLLGAESEKILTVVVQQHWRGEIPLQCSNAAVFLAHVSCSKLFTLITLKLSLRGCILIILKE